MYLRSLQRKETFLISNLYSCCSTCTFPQNAIQSYLGPDTTMIYKIIDTVYVLSMTNWPVQMRACKRICDFKFFCFCRHNLKTLSKSKLSRYLRSNFKYIKQILELEKNLPNFHLGWPTKKEENKEDLQRFACLDDRELDVEEAQAKTTKHVTKCAVYIFSRNFLHLLNVLQ